MTFAGALDTSAGIQVRTKLAQLGFDVQLKPTSRIADGHHDLAVDLIDHEIDQAVLAVYT